jgi:hypothetical protein
VGGVIDMQVTRTVTEFLLLGLLLPELRDGHVAGARTPAAVSYGRR